MQKGTALTKVILKLALKKGRGEMRSFSVKLTFSVNAGFAINFGIGHAFAVRTVATVLFLGHQNFCSKEACGAKGSQKYGCTIFLILSKSLTPASLSTQIEIQ